ncbi:PREDICTED: trimethylguanosine synthase [Bactrocera latifrons]|uniref:Trimethylguanosine synthase n=2 Tax=Bactrocera latifrons TaxID=174628 RepID=A0A0K8VR66_BACLA|nr:PREDICTED: trimethylguanosine synthase [Bactrocera latifrons]
MHEYIVESTGCQPQLYVFNQIFKAYESLDYVRRYITDSYESKQQKTFLDFWYSNGDSIVYNKYYDKECEKELAERTLNYDYENVIAESEEKRKQIWEEHYEKIYIEQYQLYAIIFYEYYKHLHKSLDEERIEFIADKLEEHINSCFAEDFAQLELLGLPTAFGKSKSNRKTQLQRYDNLQQVYSGFFSDEEDSSSMDSQHFQKNTVKDLDKEVKETSTLCDIKEKKIKKKRANRKLRNVPEFLLENKEMMKYWRKRFSLFSRYDDGIRLDCESWFSVTPEKIAAHLAERLSCDVILDAFCGCGGNAIQFARTCKRVIAIDIDPVKISMAKHNAKIYGVADKIDFIIGDVMHIDRTCNFRCDIVFLSPPWGGPKYKRKESYDIESYLQPSGASKLMEIAKQFSENVVFYLPRNACIKQVVELAGFGNRCEVEHNYLDSRLVAISVLYGENILKVN